MQNYLLYQAIGARVDECRFALLKYLSIYNLKPPANVFIKIYTDKPAVFDAYSSFFPDFQMVETAKLKQKIDLLKNDYGNLLYCDTDTYPNQTLEHVFNEINNGSSFLYKSSIPPKKNFFYDAKSAISEKKISFDGREINLTKDLKSWKSCIIGIRKHDDEQVTQIEHLSSVFHKYKFSVNASQKLSLKYQLSQQKLYSADDYFIRYKKLKEFKQLLKLFFARNEEESIPNLVKLSHYLDAAQVQKEKDAFEQQPLYKKFISRLTGKAWTLKQYERKF